MIAMSVSHEALDSNKQTEELIIEESILNCANKRWSSFICLLALSSVTAREIVSYYPDIGVENFKLFFNQKIQPRLPSLSVVALHILFCYEGILPSGVLFKHNHFVPLIKLPLLGKKRKYILSNKSCKSKQMKLSFKVEPVVTPSLVVTSSSTSPSSIVTSNSVIESYSNVNNMTSFSSASENLTNTYDIINFKDKVATMKTSDISDLLTNIFKPNNKHCFPKTNKRSFRHEWLARFSWLCYSPGVDGCFCISCFMFGHKFSKKAYKIKKLFHEPFKYWPDATAAFLRHESSKCGMHADTMTILCALQSNISGQTLPINILVDVNLRKQIADNRKKLEPIIDTIVLCGRLGLAYRGHRDDKQYHAEVGEYSKGGVGNFVELLNYRIRGGDVVLQEHLTKCNKNSSYISKTSQNHLIKCCGQIITDEIIFEVKKNKFFSIIADEARDCSNKEQMSLVLRFVDSNCDIREDFIRFVHCDEGLSGKELYSVLYKSLTADLKLDVLDCRGQGYDRAGAVSGHINGLSAHFLKINDKAVYTHCHSHRLNLVICSSCSIQFVRNVMDQIKEISYFFNLSQTRQNVLEKSISEHSPDSKKKKLIDVCRTRWVERVYGLDIFEEIYVSIVFAFEEMSLNVDRKSNRDTSSKASSLLKLITSFEFIVTLVLTRSVLDFNLPITELLQRKANDIMEGIHLIETLKSVGIETRNSVDMYHSQWYEKAVALAAKVNVKESKPRIASMQKNRDNPPSETPSEYFKKAITIPMLDHLNTELDNRFKPNSVTPYYGLAIIPGKMISLLNDPDKNWKERFQKFADFYHTPSFFL